MKHTPGPWEIDKQQPYDWEVTISNKHMQVASARHLTDSPDVPCEETMANARLIAAAPDLLFALEEVIKYLPTYRDWLDPVIERFCNHAIQKARGES
jgi:hypothetical protein